MGTGPFLSYLRLAWRCAGVFGRVLRSSTRDVPACRSGQCPIPNTLDTWTDPGHHVHALSARGSQGPSSALLPLRRAYLGGFRASTQHNRSRYVPSGSRRVSRSIIVMSSDAGTFSITSAAAPFALRHQRS